MHDSVPAEFACPACGKRGDYLLQTHVFDREGRTYQVGDHVEAKIPPVYDEEYIMLERGDDLEPEHISALEVWYCRDCGARNIARLDVDHAKITGVSSIVLSPSTLAPVTRVSFNIGREEFTPIVERMFQDVLEEVLVCMTLNDRINAIVNGELYADRDDEFAEDES